MSPSAGILARYPPSWVREMERFRLMPQTCSGSPGYLRPEKGIAISAVQPESPSEVAHSQIVSQLRDVPPTTDCLASYCTPARLTPRM